jgi:hypothetical protein
MITAANMMIERLWSWTLDTQQQMGLFTGSASETARLMGKSMVDGILDRKAVADIAGVPAEEAGEVQQIAAHYVEQRWDRIAAILESRGR